VETPTTPRVVLGVSAEFTRAKINPVIRWGVVGPGKIAAQFAEGMTMVPDGTIVAVASRAIQRANAFADRFGAGTRYGDYASLAEDPAVDAVYVATPHSRHAADSIMFLEAGKHVLCEKPLAVSAHEASAMVHAARANGVFLMEAMWSRFLPAYRILVDLLGEGRIGEPLVVEADFGFRVPVEPDHRLFDTALGGGATLDLGVYTVQLCTLVLGPPERVVADGVVGSTIVDEVVAAVLHHRRGRLGVVKAAIRVALACRGRVGGTEGWIDLPAPMHCPRWLEVGDARGTERIEAGYEGEGLRFQVIEVHDCLAAGRLESETMPLDESVVIARALDQIRSQVGIEVPLTP
jgi:predicted dehydrogenase